MTGYIRVLLGMVLGLALVGAACSSSEDDVTAGGTADTPTETETATETATETPTETEAPTETATPEELPASFRGVSETTIKVGVAVPDFDALQAAGVPNYQGSAETAFQPFFDRINEAGGIYGRQIEPVYIGFDFLDPVGQEAACTEFVEDEEVFIVLYGMRPEGNLCLTDLNDTMVMTRSFQTSETRERSGDTVWLQLNAVDDARMRIMATVVAASGRLDGKTIGIVGGEEDATVLAETLGELGFEAELAVATADPSDPLAVQSEQQIVAEFFLTEGVDFAFTTGGGGNITAEWARAGFTPEMAYKALGSSVDGAEDRSLLDGGISVAEVNDEIIFADPDFRADCMDVVLEDHPELEEEFSFLPDGDQQAAGEPNWLNPVLIACNQTMLLKELGEIAGANLTNDTFRAALDELGTIRLHGYGQASYNSESKWDGLDEFYIQEYDFETDSIRIVGDPIIIDRG